MENIKEFNLSQVKITEAYRMNALHKEIDYLKAIDRDKLLAGFFEVRGLVPKKEKYGGWENTEIKGHTLGHYLTAVSQAYLYTGDSELLDILSYSMEQLKLCQLESGYLSAFEERLFDNVENKKPAWVPWYTMHKIISGLIQVYYGTHNQTALEIVTQLGDWVYQRTSKWSEEIRKRVLAVEYGGMNDCMYELYKITKNENHLIAAHKFDELDLFMPIAEGKDILNGRHANTTIPKFIGALNRYNILGENEEFYLTACVNFWDMVVGNHSYITGGNSEWEHFGETQVLDAERTNCTCETCNTYNMLKLSHELFKVTGDKKYADFYENTLTNAILASQNPETGMTTYFQPMATGYFKVYSTPFDKFWCCTGTGMENFTKLNSSIYFWKENTVFVNQYVSSELSIDNYKFKLVQESTIPEQTKVKFMIETIQNQRQIDLRLRLPDWTCGPVSILINGVEVESLLCDGYFKLNRKWSNGDVIELDLPMNITVWPLPDNPDVVAFKYGPVVLSAALGKEDLETSATGVMVTIPTKNMPIKDFIIVSDGEVREWFECIKQNMVRCLGEVAFTLHNTDEDHHLIFTPHYKQHKERYGIYWRFVKPNSPELKAHLIATAKKEKLEEATIDSIPIGNDQYELKHKIKGEQTEVKVLDENYYRVVQKDGWFSYQMKVNPKELNILQVSYYSKLHGKAVGIYINEQLIDQEIVKPMEPFKIYSKAYELPLEVTKDRETVIVKFVPLEGKDFGGIFNILRMLKEFH